MSAKTNAHGPGGAFTPKSGKATSRVNTGKRLATESTTGKLALKVRMAEAPTGHLKTPRKDPSTVSAGGTCAVVPKPTPSAPEYQLTQLAKAVESAAVFLIHQKRRKEALKTHASILKAREQLKAERGVQPDSTPLIRAHREGDPDQARIVAPSFFWVEVGSVLLRKLQGRLLDSDKAVELWSLFLKLPIEEVSTTQVAARAWDIARIHGMRDIYDASFVAAVEITPVPAETTREVWTADEKFLDKFGSACPPFIHRLSASPPDATNPAAGEP